MVYLKKKKKIWKDQKTNKKKYTLVQLEDDGGIDCLGEETRCEGRWVGEKRSRLEKLILKIEKKAPSFLSQLARHGSPHLASSRLSPLAIRRSTFTKTFQPYGM